MGFRRKIFFKWLGITVVCGAHSFFWGTLVGGNVFAMLLGMLTHIVTLTAIESHAFYQGKKAADTLLAQALKLGIKLRLGFVALLCLSWLGGVLPASMRIVFAIPVWIETFIGMGAAAITGFEPARSVATEPSDSSGEIPPPPDFLITYATTIVTAVIHTLILAAICAIIYLVLQRRQRKNSL